MNFCNERSFFQPPAFAELVRDTVSLVLGRTIGADPDWIVPVLCTIEARGWRVRRIVSMRSR
jgi:hypothetical protein